MVCWTMLRALNEGVFVPFRISDYGWSPTLISDMDEGKLCAQSVFRRSSARTDKLKISTDNLFFQEGQNCPPHLKEIGYRGPRGSRRLFIAPQLLQ